MEVPRRSARTMPASRSTRRWWDTVGWLTPQVAVKSQAQMVPPLPSSRTIARRVGSASACSRRTSGSTVAGVDRRMAPTISSFVYIDNHRYLPYSSSMFRTPDNQTRDGEGETAMDLVSRLDLVDALVRDRQRDSDAAIQRHTALASGRTGRQRSLTDRLTVVLGSNTSPSRI